MGRILRTGGRIFHHGSALKSMAKLGDRAFGPKCPSCGFPQTDYMASVHREAVEAVTGKRVEDLRYICRCVRPAS